MKTLKQIFISILEAIQEAKAYKARKYKNIL
jgi:hypothetical protein